MKKLKLLVTIILLSTQPLFAESFGEFVSGNLTRLHHEIFGEVATVNRYTKPQEVKALRKKIGLYKIYLDLGIYLYPENNGLKLSDIRDEFDLAYEYYGNFKDLYDTAEHFSDLSEEQKLRDKVIKWNRKVESETDSWLDFIASPLNSGRAKVKKKNLPKFLWAKVSFKPDADEDATDVLMTLTNDIFEEAADDSKDFLKIKTLMKYKDEEAFHDFRKLIRTSLKLVAELPEVRSQVNEYSFSTLETMIGKIGDINDLLVAYHKTGKKGLKNDIEDSFDELKDWMKGSDIKDHLEDIL